MATVNTVLPRNEYTATAGQTIFPYAFLINEAQDLVVLQNGTTLVQDTDYTVAGVGSDTGGSITLTTGAALDDSIIVFRDTVIQRDPKFTTAGIFRADTVETEEIDQYLIMQELERDNDRKLGLADSSTVDPANLFLPEPEDGKALIWDGNDGSLRNSTEDIDTLAATVAQAVTDAQTAESNAATSAANAATSAGNAATSEANAATSETNAAASAAAAAQSATEGLYETVTSISDADSPFVPALANEGTLYRVDTTAGNVIVNLSDLDTYAEDMKFAFVKTDNSANTVTINVDAGDTLDGTLGGNFVLDEENNVVNFIGQLSSNAWHTNRGGAVIGTNSVTLSQIQQIADQRILGNVSGGTADIAELTGTQVTALLDGATELLSGVVELATQAEVDAGADTSRVVTPATLQGKIDAVPQVVQGTSQDINGLSVISFTGLPSDLVELKFDVIDVDVSASGNATFQIGDSGGFATTGYATVTENQAGTILGNTNASSANAPVSLDSGNTSFLSGRVTKVGTNEYHLEYRVSEIAGAAGARGVVQGSVTLTGDMDRVRIVAGAGTFTAGTANITYWRE